MQDVPAEPDGDEWTSRLPRLRGAGLRLPGKAFGHVFQAGVHSASWSRTAGSG